MKTLNIIKHGPGDYTVDVNHFGNKGNTSHDFDDHDNLTDFVNGLKNSGYQVKNDSY